MKSSKLIPSIFFLLAVLAISTFSFAEQANTKDGYSVENFDFMSGDDVKITCKVKPDVVCAEGESGDGGTWKVYGDQAEIIIEQE